MAKVFTITQGLENMGAMKTGGQGSVYKGRRIGEIITAVKLLPTPVFSEMDEDKNFRDFKNEVQKLKRVNEKPNPNVVKILSSGLSETGNFPFIEMEYIEGPDLEELLKPPHDPVFTIKEAIKVAEQLLNALAHCHSLDVKHGDIKSNNVKFNIHTGNYILLDFGLAIMSDEQRRTSLRQAGAVEFMAPEQNEGQMLFETDVYSFGIVLFELLAGRVPFPLHDKGETARNNVRLAHMDTLPPDVVSLRKEALPLTWPQDKKEREMDIPEWLITLIYKCLDKKPQERFANGIELNNFIAQNSIHALNSRKAAEQQAGLILREKQQLQQQLLQYSKELTAKESEYEELTTAVKRRETKSRFVKEGEAAHSSAKEGVDKSFIALLFLAVVLAGFSGYSYFKNSSRTSELISDTTKENARQNKDLAAAKKTIQRKKVAAFNKKANTDTNASANRVKKTVKKLPEQSIANEKDMAENDPDQQKSGKIIQYTVISKAYFHNTPDESTRREAYINHWNNAVLTPSDDLNGFIYIVYTNDKGQTSRGWLRKKDLQPLK